MLQEASEVKLLENVSLAQYTSFHIGGPASFFAEVSGTEPLSGLIHTAFGLNVPLLILGGGTNLLIDDRGFDGLVIWLTMDGMSIDEERNTVTVGASVKTSDFVEKTVASGLSGTSFAAGLPGTLGGALAGNAGCFGRCLGDIVLTATVVQNNGDIIKVENADWFEFEYRHSALLASRAVLTEAVFNLSRGDKELLRTEADANIALRREKHPLPGAYTAGSYFKNLPPDQPNRRRTAAGLLLDQVGARKLSVGDAAVFERHANIIINRGNASCSDVLQLANAMRNLVYDRFGVNLEPEVRYVSPRG